VEEERKYIENLGLRIIVKEQLSWRTACWEHDQTGGAHCRGRDMVRVT